MMNSDLVSYCSSEQILLTRGIYHYSSFFFLSSCAAFLMFQSNDKKYSIEQFFLLRLNFEIFFHFKSKKDYVGLIFSLDFRIIKLGHYFLVPNK